MKKRSLHPYRLAFGIAAVALALSTVGVSTAQAVNPLVNIPESSDGFVEPAAPPEIDDSGDDTDRDNDDEIVDVPDPLLAEAILAKTGKTEMTRATLRKLVTLNIDGLDVKDLTGLQYATRLSKLEMRDTLVTTLAPLAGAESLMYLYAGYQTSGAGTVLESPLSNISALRELPLLNYVALNGADITDIEPLRGAEGLVRVEVANVTKLRDLSPLSKSPILREVYAQGTAVSDLSPLSDLPEMRTISVPNANVSDISVVAGLPHLSILNVNGNHVTDISMIDTWPSLQQVGFKNQTLSLPRVFPSATETTYVNLDTAEPFSMPGGASVVASTGAEAVESGGTLWSGLDRTEEEIAAVFEYIPEGGGAPHYSATATYPVTFADFDLAPAQGEHVAATEGRALAFDFSTIEEFAGGDYTLRGGTIPGMTLSSDGQLSGVPSAAGHFSPVVELTDKHGNAIERSFELELSQGDSGGSDDPVETPDGGDQTAPGGGQTPQDQGSKGSQLAHTGMTGLAGTWLVGAALLVAGAATLGALRKRRAA
ncbi:hypothetical protein ICL81_10780 [Leucobacter sp. cx-328]|uniref:leucine-rich repeat domain-containing protein n=1 Tax=unclassified Leucobacter TaxID=2621730 RepID=UPI00165D815D|nr:MULTISPECIES: leucine-rich repeat domain-containing protein [unclassified Leucobacter]MBC9944983.1 hypothetical protein [Leucobacter sp. cx-328]